MGMGMGGMGGMGMSRMGRRCGDVHGLRNFVGGICGALEVHERASRRANQQETY